MKDKIESILSEVKTRIAAASSENELQNVKSAYVGKQGSLSLLMKELPKLDVSLRPEMGKLLNQAKNEVTELIDAKRLELKLKAPRCLRTSTALCRESCLRKVDFIRLPRCATT